MQATLGIGVATALAGVFGVLWRRRDVLSGSLQVDEGLAGSSHHLGEFIVSVSGRGLTVAHRDSPRRILWSTPEGKSFVCAAVGRERVSEARGHFTVKDRLLRTHAQQTIEGLCGNGENLRLHGRLGGGEGSVTYRLVLTPQTEHRLRLEIEVEEPCNRVYLTGISSQRERFFGFGTQYTHFDLKGRRVPIFIQEQGIGRGAQPITLAADLRAGAGGAWHSSYACVPHYITSELRSLFLENHEYSSFDLTHPRRVRVEVFSNRMTAQLIHGESPAELIERYTQYSGRMPELPHWVHDGAILGLQGGTQRVMRLYEKLRDVGTPVTALWLQDWVGRRRTSFGAQLWWNWELDRTRYPGWAGMQRRLEDEGVRVMIYLSPFLADASQKPGHHHNLFREAKERGFLVRNHRGEVYLQRITDFSAALVDLTNPQARDWLEGVIRQSVRKTGAAGWMADFGEGLPYDAVLYSGAHPRSFHNRYAEEWARVNRRARTGDELFFMRSGFLRSPGHSTLFWLGDQLVSWDRHDGIKSAVTGLLSSGLSGYSLNHADTGGYTAIDNPLLRYHRSKELLLRWIELSAFTTVLRTHEGNRPEDNHQIYSDPGTTAHFARFARVYAALKPYRKRLVAEASATGIPVVRHPFVHYPTDRRTYDLTRQFMLGPEFMVAPVLDRGATRVGLYLPAGEWIHLWSARAYGSSNQGTDITVEAPVGSPPVFYRADAQSGPTLRATLQREGLL